jgi:CysZ protein
MANVWGRLVGGTLAGASYPVRAIALFLQRPKLLIYLVVPLIINVLLGILLYVGLLLPGWRWLGDLALQLNGWLNTWEAGLPDWLYWLSGMAWAVGWVLRSLLVVLLLGAIGFVLAQFGTLLGAPWYGQLSEQIERLRLGQLELIEVGLVRDIGRALGFELKKLALLVGAGLLFLLLNLLPGLGTSLGALGGLMIATLLTGLDFLDSPLERRRLRFRRKLGLWLGNAPATVSFSLTCLVLLTVPLLNLVMVPVCVAGGTLFFCDRLWPQHFASSDHTLAPGERPQSSMERGNESHRND